MSSYLILHNDLELDFTEYPLEKLRPLIEEGGVLFWSMNGLLGKLPNAVLVDSLRLYDIDEAGASRGRRQLTPGDPVWLIHWHQTVTPQDHLAALESRLLRQTPQ